MIGALIGAVSMVVIVSVVIFSRTAVLGTSDGLFREARLALQDAKAAKKPIDYWINDQRMLEPIVLEVDLSQYKNYGIQKKTRFTQRPQRKQYRNPVDNSVSERVWYEDTHVDERIVWFRNPVLRDNRYQRYLFVVFYRDNTGAPWCVGTIGACLRSPSVQDDQPGATGFPPLE
jgi:hypothetical protein